VISLSERQVQKYGQSTYLDRSLVELWYKYLLRPGELGKGHKLSLSELASLKSSQKVTSASKPIAYNLSLTLMDSSPTDGPRNGSIFHNLRHQNPEPSVNLLSWIFTHQSLLHSETFTPILVFHDAFSFWA